MCTSKIQNRRFNAAALLRGILIAAFLLCSRAGLCQNSSLSTNGIEWLTLGTINAEVGVPVSRHVSVHLGGAYNPFSFGKSSSPVFFRRAEIQVKGRFWPWFVNSGWYLLGGADWCKFSFGGITSKSSYEGYAYGVKAGGGYALLLTKRLNLEMGAGLFLGLADYTKYQCTRCGDPVLKRKKFIVSPADIVLGVSFLF